MGIQASEAVHHTDEACRPYRYRNRMDFRVVDGRPAMHRQRSNELVPLDEPLLVRLECSELFLSDPALAERP